jgi:hypothetical protein
MTVDPQRLRGMYLSRGGAHHCSFCGKFASEADAICVLPAASDRVAICNQCIDVMHAMIHGQRAVENDGLQKLLGHMPEVRFEPTGTMTMGATGPAPAEIVRKALDGTLTIAINPPGKKP